MHAKLLGLEIFAAMVGTEGVWLDNRDGLDYVINLWRLQVVISKQRRRDRDATEKTGEAC